MLTRAQKEAQANELRDKFGRARCVYAADYRGTDVESVSRLRGRIRQQGDWEYRVVKNSVLRRAAAETPVSPLVERFKGPTSIAISYGDPVGLAKLLIDFSKEHEVFTLKGGVLEGQAIGPAQIATLAELPSLDELRGKIVGLLQAPATKLVRLLAEPGAQIARVVSARGDQAAS